MYIHRDAFIFALKVLRLDQDDIIYDKTIIYGNH